MRIAFLIRRKNYYRPLGPVVEEALRRGYQVECWHDYRDTPRDGKVSEFPDLVPAFRAGSPTVHRFYGAADLAKKFRADSPDAVICLDPPDADVKGVAKAKWIWLQYSTDLVFDRNPQGILDSEAVGTYSPYWAQKVEERYRDSGLAAELQRKMVPVGVPELDVVPTIDPEDVRRRYGLPPGRPVVLYLSFPLRSNPQTFWLRHVFAPSTRLEQGLRTVLGWRVDYWPHVVNGWNDHGLVRALRAFCDRNGALLVVKSRLKDPIPRYARRLADRVLYDPSHYPPTVLELLSVASLCIQSYSTAVLEAAYCGVPSLCLAPDAVDMGLQPLWVEFVHNGNSGGIYNWPGVAYWKPLATAFDGLPRWSLADFAHDRGAQRSYVERFLGFDDGRSSSRLLDLVTQLLQDGSAGHDRR